MKERVRRALADAPKEFRADYMHVDQTLCKNCGTPIRQIKEVKPHVFAPVELTNYKEITIKFDDDSAHVTCICKQCAKALSISELERIYCADLIQWQSEGTKILRIWADRQITGYE